MIESSSRESALSWLQRVRINKKRLTQNPIVFPTHHSRNEPIDDTAAIDIPTNQQDDNQTQTQTQETDQFQVNTRNMIQLAHEAFINNTTNLQEYQMRLERYKRTKQQSIQLESNFLSSFTIGTQIDFLNISNNASIEIQTKLSSVATELLTILTANYAASTSINCMKISNSNHETQKGGHVILFDPEYKFNPIKLEHHIRIAVYKRWNQSAPFRKLHLKEYTSQEEERDIQLDIESILHRIHILHPRNIHQEGIALLELLQQAPCMIVMNDLSCFTNVNRMYESLGKGLSGVHDFIRHFKKWNSDQVCIVGARYITGDVDVDIANHTSSNPMQYQDGLEKLMTHSVTIVETRQDSPEYHEGYDYVALNVKSLHSNSDAGSIGFGSMANRRFENQVQGKMFPFNITSNGVKCKVGL